MSLARLTELPDASTHTAPPADTASTHPLDLFWPGLLVAIATTSMLIGIIWDISWHISIGRDTFWTPAHLAVQFGGILAGGVGGWLAFRHTFLLGTAGRGTSVGIFGVRAPLGAWVMMWGAVAMLTSAPFDDWWHNAYGLDVKIVSPPHTVLGLGMLAVSLGALLIGLAHQNRVNDAAGNALFIYIGGIFLALGSVFLMEFTTPNLQHAAIFHLVCALTFPVRVVMLGVAGRISFPATRAAFLYLLLQGAMTWILPLFPAQPKLAPIFNPITHMVPPAFPLLLFVPALAIDLLLRRTGTSATGWRRLVLAGLLGLAFVAVFSTVQWFFSQFLLTPAADNWFFAGNRYWGYNSSPGRFASRFWGVTAGMPFYNPFTMATALWGIAIATLGAWLGLLWGGWMRKVLR